MSTWASNAGGCRHVRAPLSHHYPPGNALADFIGTRGDPSSRVSGTAAVGDARGGPAVAGHPPGRLTVQPSTRLGRRGVSEVGRWRTRSHSLSAGTPDVLVIDDHDGREEAARRTIAMIGTIGVLKQRRSVVSLTCPCAGPTHTTTFHGPRASLPRCLPVMRLAKPACQRTAVEGTARLPPVRGCNTSITLFHKFPGQGRWGCVLA
jgi:hypothetical protein